MNWTKELVFKVFSTYNLVCHFLARFITFSIKIAFYGVRIQFMGWFGYRFLTVVCSYWQNW